MLDQRNSSRFAASVCLKEKKRFKRLLPERSNGPSCGPMLQFLSKRKPSCSCLLIHHHEEAFAITLKLTRTGPSTHPRSLPPPAQPTLPCHCPSLSPSGSASSLSHTSLQPRHHSVRHNLAASISYSTTRENNLRRPPGPPLPVLLLPGTDRATDPTEVAGQYHRRR